MIGRHPHKLALGAWFDGEGSERVGSHVARCGRCRARVSEFARVRSWLRAQPFVAMTDDAVVDHPARRRWRPVVVAALLLFAYLALPGRGRSGDGIPAGGSLSAQGGDQPGQSAGPGTAEPGTSSAGGGSTAPGGGPDGSAGATSAERAAQPRGAGASGVAAQRPPWSSPLKLGLVVPTSGPLAREGSEVREVVARRVAAANSSGGVAGVPIELVVAPAEDPAALEAMARSVNAMVGGFGADVSTTTPWLLPADPSVTGPNVVPAEGSARAVGAQLASDLRAQGLGGPVGVIVGSGPDAALAAGLASKAPVTTVAARKDTTCLTELATLHRSGATAVAVAGDTDLVATCVRAAARSPWRARIGPLVAPSAAYSGIGSLPEATGTRTVLALPWPTSSSPGAARFRASTVSQSYRALVSYAATELAIDVARQTGTVSVEAIAGRTWQSDLVELEGTTNRAGRVTAAFLGTWLAV